MLHTHDSALILCPISFKSLYLAAHCHPGSHRQLTGKLLSKPTCEEGHISIQWVNPLCNFHTDKLNSICCCGTHKKDTRDLRHLWVIQCPWCGANGLNVLSFLWMSSCPHFISLHYKIPKLSFQPLKKNLWSLSNHLLLATEEKLNMENLIIEIWWHNENIFPMGVWWKSIQEYINGKVDRAQEQCYLNIMIAIHIISYKWCTR